MGKASRKKKSRAISILAKSEASKENFAKSGAIYNRVIHIILIAVIGIIIYFNTFNSPFQFDDRYNIAENQKLRVLSNFWPPSGSRWIGFLTFAINYHLGGLNVPGYHIVNLLIHLLNAILVYWFVILTFKTPYFMVRHFGKLTAHHDDAVTLNMSKDHRFTHLPSVIALFSALIFVSHPIQTQAVTYIVQRFTSLATMFYLLSLVMYINFRLWVIGNRSEGKSPPYHLLPITYYPLSILSAVLAMKTKEIAFTLPIIISLYEFMFFGGLVKKKMLHLIPPLLTMLIIPLNIIGIDKSIGDAIGELREAVQETAEIPRWNYLFTQFRVMVTYLRLLFLPLNQNLDYDYPVYRSFFDPNVFLSFLFLLFIFSLGIYLLIRSLKIQESKGSNNQPLTFKPFNFKLISFGILWFFITLSVESSIIPIRDVIFEHRLYLPSIGVIIAFSIVVFHYVLRITHRASRLFVATGYLLLAAVILFLSSATYQRNVVWQDEIRLWEDVVKKSPSNLRGHINVGSYYFDKGFVDKAMKHFAIALSLRPDDVGAHTNMGNVYWAEGLMDKAAEHYQIAIRLRPDAVETYNNLAVIYRKKGMIDKAIEHVESALKLKPGSAEIQNNAGNIYSDRGWFDKAIEHYRIASRLKPDDAEVHYNLGIVYKQKMLIDEAIKEFQIALQIKPDFIEARQNLKFLSKFKKM